MSLRFAAKFLILLFPVACFAIPVVSVNAQAPAEFSVMSWNIWHGGKEDGDEIGPQKVVEIIKESGVDIVAMQETYGSGERISEQLGFHFHPRGTNLSIHSRFPVLEDLSVFEEFKCVGALIQLPDETRIAFYSIWLPYNAEIWEKGTRDVSDLESMKHACQASCDDLVKIKAAIAERLDKPEYADVPVIIAGDFNSMSHLDYVEPFKDQFDDVVIDWPTSHVLMDDGFHDAWRELNPEVNRAADRTWTPRFADQQQDRIDYVYYRGKGMEATGSHIIDTWKDGFPSDHAALVSKFQLQSGEQPASLRVLSYNIKHGLGNDGEQDLNRTAAVIRNVRADIVGLQEVDQKVRRSGNVNQAVALGEATGLNPAFGSFMDYQGGQYGLAILSRFPIESSEEVRLPDGNEPRVALACRIRLPDDQRITVVNLHFDWVEDDEFRFAQATRLHQYLATIETPVILLGDFNDVPGSRTLELLADGRREATKPESDKLTFSATEPEMEIDFLFASPQGKWRLNWCRVLDGKITSDHRPVLAGFQLLIR